MDYAPLISEATKRQGWTRYQVAKALGYKNVSKIYEVEKGEKGMSVDKYDKLLKLAGKQRGMILTSILLFLAAVALIFVTKSIIIGAATKLKDDQIKNMKEHNQKSKPANDAKPKNVSSVYIMLNHERKNSTAFRTL